MQIPLADRCDKVLISLTGKRPRGLKNRTIFIGIYRPKVNSMCDQIFYDLQIHLNCDPEARELLELSG